MGPETIAKPINFNDNLHMTLCAKICMPGQRESDLFAYETGGSIMEGWRLRDWRIRACACVCVSIVGAKNGKINMKFGLR